jgi:enoyl-CoA hydratase/carnithine racemase
VNQVFPLPELMTAARQMAAEIRTRIPQMVKHFKKVIDGGMGKSLDDAWAYELQEFEGYLHRMLGH